MQRRGEVVDPVHAHGGDDRVERVLGERKRFFIGDEALDREGAVPREGGIAVEERVGDVGADEVGDAGGDRDGLVWTGFCEAASDVASAGAEVKDAGKRPG